MSVTVTKVAATVASEIAKDPKQFFQNCVAIFIGLVGSIIVIIVLLCSTVTVFYGESLSEDGVKMESYEAAQAVIGVIANYMAELAQTAEQKKNEIIEKRKEVKTHYFYNEKYSSYVEINKRANQLKESYNTTENLISCEVLTTTNKKYSYIVSGKKPDGSAFTEIKEFNNTEDIKEYITSRFNLGYSGLMRTKEQIVYYANYSVQVTTCDIQFEESWRTIPVSYLMAYMSTMSFGAEKLDFPNISDLLKHDFLTLISPLKINDLSMKEEKKVSFKNEVLSPEAIAVLIWPEDELRQSFFLDSQEAYADLLKEGNKVYVNFNYVDVELPIHDYYQTNYRDIKYGNGTIASSGCGPTCIAMITTYLTGQVTSPVEVCKWCEADYYVPGAGTAWSVFAGAADHYGYGCIDMGLQYEDVLAEIASGKPVVVLVGPGTFTSEGHYMVIKGMTASGELILNDPNQNNLNKYGTNKFSAETVLGEAKNFWVFFN